MFVLSSLDSRTCPLGGISELFSAIQDTERDINSGTQVSRLHFNKPSCPNICFGLLVTIITPSCLLPVWSFCLCSNGRGSVTLDEHWLLSLMLEGGEQDREEGKGGVSRDLPSQLLLRYTDTNTGGTVKKSTTEFTSSQNHSLSFAAINWRQKVRQRGHHTNIRENLNVRWSNYWIPNGL